MKAISLHQPWASLIAMGIKTIETRSWAPPKSLIGERIVIHAAKKVAKDEQLDQPVRTACREIYGTYWEANIPIGKVVATAILSDYVHVKRQYMDGYVEGFNSNDKLIRIGRDHYGDFETGRFLWILEDIKRIEPVAAVGHQGFWNWDPESIEGVES